MLLGLMGKIYGYLFNELNAGRQIHPEIDELPLDPFLLVFFLFQDEHVMVEKLLQLFVGEINAQLLHAVVLNTTGKDELTHNVQ